jgi:hypothetical protein
MFSKDIDSVDALLRPGRIAKQVEFTGTSTLKDMVCMMLGVGPAASDDEAAERQAPFKMTTRLSQFETERSDIVREHAERIQSLWCEIFGTTTKAKQQQYKQSPTSDAPLDFTLSDFKNYLGQYFSGEQSWGSEISARQKQKLAQAADVSNMRDYQQRLMELRRDAVAKSVAHEPERLQQLQQLLTEKGDEVKAKGFFEVRVAQAKCLIAELARLAPATEADLPTFDRPYKLRATREQELLDMLQAAVDAAERGKVIVVDGSGVGEGGGEGAGKEGGGKGPGKKKPGKKNGKGSGRGTAAATAGAD